jgi:hypothetical protein
MFLIFSGGQNYWSDEIYRYNKSRLAVERALSGDIKGAVRALNPPDHYLFKVIGVIPATIEAAILPTPKIPALFFTLFSTLNLWLLWRLSRRMGSSEYEALITVTLLSLATSFFYVCRHIVPYDISMTFGLLAIMSALKQPSRNRDSLLCGLMAACTFLTYNGYWTMAAFALLLHAAPSLRQPGQLARRAFFSGIVFIAPILFVILFTTAFGEKMRFLIDFSDSVTQGVFSEGWSLPVEYFWHTEHFLIIFWCVAFAYCLREAKNRRITKLGLLGIAGVMFIYGTQVFCSVVLHKFVVYGRLARQCVPFFCLLTAYWIEMLRTSDARGRYISYAVLSLIVLQAGFNFYQPLVQVFPADFRKTAVKITSSSKNHEYDLLVLEYSNYYSLMPKFSSLKPHRTIIQSPNPLEYLPYQYDGYTPDERNKLRSTNIQMRLIDYAIE